MELFQGIDVKSSHDYDTSVLDGEPLKPDTARAQIRAILEGGSVAWRQHALDEMKKDNISTLDAVGALRSGVVQPPDFEKGTWRYRVQSGRLTVVVAFRSQSELVVVTAWRGRR